MLNQLSASNLNKSYLNRTSMKNNRANATSPALPAQKADSVSFKGLFKSAGPVSLSEVKAVAENLGPLNEMLGKVFKESKELYALNTASHIVDTFNDHVSAKKLSGKMIGIVDKYLQSVEKHFPEGFKLQKSNNLYEVVSTSRSSDALMRRWTEFFQQSGHNVIPIKKIDLDKKHIIEVPNLMSDGKKTILYLATDCEKTIPKDAKRFNMTVYTNGRDFKLGDFIEGLFLKSQVEHESINPSIFKQLGVKTKNTVSSDYRQKMSGIIERANQEGFVVDTISPVGQAYTKIIDMESGYRTFTNSMNKEAEYYSNLPESALAARDILEEYANTATKKASAFGNLLNDGQEDAFAALKKLDSSATASSASAAASSTTSSTSTALSKIESEGTAVAQPQKNIFSSIKSVGPSNR